MSVIAIIAALERELSPLVRDWKSRSFDYDGRNFRVHEHKELVAVAGGIGRRAAATAARAMVDRYHPQVLVSAGVAGALAQGLRVGTVILPNRIIDSADRREYRCDSGSGTLVTADEIADAASKQVLADEFHALAVDMEAAGVAAIAQRQQIRFGCVKAISDEIDFVMPPINWFVDGEGRFHTTSFGIWAALRPARWPGLVTLARNTRLASIALCNYLKEIEIGGHSLANAERKISRETI